MKAQFFFSRDLLRALSQNTTELTTRPEARLVVVFFLMHLLLCVYKSDVSIFLNMVSDIHQHLTHLPKVTGKKLLYSLS